MASGSSSGRRSWKETAAERRQRAPGVRWTMRLATTLLLAMLVAAFVWRIVYRGVPPAQLVIVQVADYDKLAAPPLPYARETETALTSLQGETVHAVEARQALPTAKVLDILRDRLSGVGPKDVLLLAMAMHGVSDGDQAYLLGSDYQPRSAAGRVRVADVLREISACPAKTKLVLLNAGTISSDPAMGLLVNEFPRLLAEEVQNTGDGRLWVLVSHGMFQTSHVAHGQRRTVFAHMLHEALTGAGHTTDDGGNGNQELELDELYRYLCRRAADWIDPSGSPGQQPLLLRGGEGVVAPETVPPNITLVSLSRLLALRAKQAAEEKAAAEKAAKEKANSPPAGDPAAAEKKQAAAPRGRDGVGLAFFQPGKSGAPPPAEGAPGVPPPAAVQPPEADAAAAPSKAPPAAAPPANPAAAPPAPPAGPPPETRSPLLAALEEAWRLRDELSPPRTWAVARQNPNRWSPVDFAPHHWRVFEARLLACEVRARAGEAIGRDALTADVQALADGLRKLRERMRGAPAQPRPPAGAADVEDRLIEAWDRFRQEVGDSIPPDVAPAVAAAQVYADALYQAPNYVAWHDAESYSSTGRPPAYDNILALLAGLEKLGAALDAARGRPLTPGDERDFRALTAEVERARDALNDLLQPRREAPSADQRRRERLVAAGLRQRVDLLADRVLEDALATPLLPAAARTALADNLLVEKDPPAPRNKPLPAFRGLTPAPVCWRRLQDRAELHVRLAALGGFTALGDDGENAWENLKTALATLNAEPYEACRELSALLRNFYASLPAVVEQSSARDAATAEPSARRAAWLIDARDVRGLRGPIATFAAYRFTPAPRPERLTLVAPPEPLVLDVQQWRLLDVQVTAEGDHAPTAAVTVSFDAARLAVRKADDRSPVAPESSFPVTFDGRGAAFLPLEVRALRETGPGDAEQAVVRIAAASAATRVPASDFPVRLPRPNDYDLIATRLGAAQDETGAGDRVRLRPYPNRETGYRLALRNLSGKAKSVTVELLAAPRPAGANWRIGQLFDERGQLQPGVERALFDPANRVHADVRRVAVSAQPVALPASPEPVAVALAPAPPPPGAAPPPAGQPPAATSEPIDVSHGLAVVIVNAQDPADRRVKWLELAPLTPDEYLDVNVAYRPQPSTPLGTITVTVSPRGALPADLEKKPIVVSWDTAGVVAPEAAKVEQGLLAANQLATALSADVSANGVFRDVRLTADGYPRALVYRVLCGETPTKGERLDVALKGVRIAALWSPAFSRGYTFGPHGALPPEAKAADGKPLSAVRVAAGEKAAFPLVEKLFVRLEVDAPTDAFVLPFAVRQDWVKVSLGGANVDPLYAPRQMSVAVPRIGPDGALTLDTRIEDYTLTLNVAGRQTRDDAVVAELFLDAERDRTPDQTDRAPVVLDGTPPLKPRLSATPDARAITVGDRVTVQARTGDDGYSGVVRLEYGLDKPNKPVEGELDADEIQTRRLGDAGPPPRDDTWTFVLDTAEWKPGPHLLLVRAVDRVDQVSELASLVLEVKAPPLPSEPSTKDKPPAGPGRGPLSGVVTRGKLKPAGVTVTLEGANLPPQKTNSQGAFTFPDVPAGTYNLKAQGAVQNTNRSGETKGVQHMPPDNPARNVTISLE